MWTSQAQISRLALAHVVTMSCIFCALDKNISEKYVTSECECVFVVLYRQPDGHDATVAEQQC